MRSKQNDQRQRRRDEAAASKTWELKHFRYIENDPVCECMMAPLLSSMRNTNLS